MQHAQGGCDANPCHELDDSSKSIDADNRNIKGYDNGDLRRDHDAFAYIAQHRIVVDEKNKANHDDHNDHDSCENDSQADHAQDTRRGGHHL